MAEERDTDTRNTSASAKCENTPLNPNLQKPRKYNNPDTEVYNISKRKLTKHESRLLSKGLKYVQTRREN